MRARTPSGCPTSACSCPRSSRSWTTSRARCTSSSTPTPREPGAYAKARARLEAAARDAARRGDAAGARAGATPQPPRSNIGEQPFYAAVAKAKRYITDGDVMQVQISQRLSQPFAGSPVNLYRALRSINPSPYMFYFDFGDSQLVGASPEILVRREGDKRHRAAHRRHAQARRDAREGPRDGEGARGRPQGARRAPHADRPRAQRHRAHRAHRHRAASRSRWRWSATRT